MASNTAQTANELLDEIYKTFQLEKSPQAQHHTELIKRPEELPERAAYVGAYDARKKSN